LNSGKFQDSLEEFVLRALPIMNCHQVGHLLLKNDPLYARIPVVRMSEAIQCGIDAGVTLAQRQTKEFQTRDPLLHADQLGVKVTHTNRDSHIGPRVYHSEYFSPPPTILIYSQSMAELERMIDKSGLRQALNIESPIPIFVAHEIYHHLETKQKPAPTERFRITTFALGPFKLTSGLVSLSEIAADAFAQEFLRLSHPPKLLEYLTIYRHNSDLAWQLVEELESLHRIKSMERE
jgi:hypothetical protein